MAKVPTLPLVVMIWMSLSCTIEVVLASRAAVIVLRESLASTSIFIKEGSNLTACATIVCTYGDLPLASSHSVLFTTSNGTAQSPYDYTAIFIVRTFDAGSSEGQSICVNISTANDTNVEYDETFSVTLTSSDPSVTIGDRGGGITFQATINDDDLAIFAFTGDAQYYWRENNTRNSLCPTLVQGNLERPVTAVVYLSSGTAIVSWNLPADVTTYWMYVYYSSGSVIGSKSCGDVYIVDDNHMENNEVFYGTIQDYAEWGCNVPTSVKSTGLSYNRTAYITIIDDEVVQISPWEGNPSLTVEGNITLNFCIQIINPVILDVPVNCSLEAISGTATRNKDFIQQSSFIMFSPGSTQNSYSCKSVDIRQDSVLEYNEFFILTLSSTNNRVVVTRNGTFQIIEDGDTVTIGFAQKVFSETEGNNNPFQICALMMIGSLERFVSVFISTLDTGATATAGTDYIALTRKEVMFSPGASAINNSMNCTVLTIINDNTLENTEALSAILTTDLTVVLIPSANVSTTIFILEDPYDYITVGFASGTPNIVTEGVNLTLKLCPAILNGSLEKDVFVIATTMDVSAKFPSDYGYASEELKFTNGQGVGNAVCFTVVINNDANVLEYTERFQVLLTQNYTAIHIPLQQRTILITILEDPNDGITVGLGSNSYQCYETGGPISLCIQMYNGNLERNVSMRITSIDGTAKAYSDYNPLDSTITFTYGMYSGSSICKNASIIDDNVVEEDFETFNLFLIATEPLVTTISLSSSIISIQERNNDVVDIGLTNKRYIGTEGCNVTICCKIFKGSIERTVSVYVSTFSGTAIEGTDFIGVSSVELRLPKYNHVNETICTDLMIINDTNIELEELFTVALETVDLAVNITQKTGTVAILIDSHDVAIFEMKVNTVTVTEGINHTFPICALLNNLSGILTTSISVGVVTKDVSSSAHVGGDYYIEPHVLVFPVGSIPGVTLMCTTVSIIDDYILENVEEFEVFLVSNDTSVVLDVQRNRTIVQIVEDGSDSITVGLNTAHSVNENQGNIEICIDIIVGALERNISVHLQTVPITATSRIDYINVEKNITFSSGLSAFLDDKLCINITIINDNVLEDAEEFQVLVTPTSKDIDVVLIPAVLSVDVVTIIEDPYDGIEVGFEHNSYNVSANDGMVHVCASIYKGTLERSVAVLIATSSDSSKNDAAIPGLDYTIVRVVINFIPGQSQFANRTQCINIGIVNVGSNKTVEEFLVFLDKVAADRSVVMFPEGLKNASIYIYNDNKEYVFQFVNTQYVEFEGSPVAICIQMIQYPIKAKMQTIPVILSTESVSATGGQDYDDSLHVLLFHPELLNGTIVTMTECTSIQIIDDHAIEGDETFEVHLVFLYTSVTNRSTAVVTIKQRNNNYAVCRFVDFSIMGVAGDNIDVCWKLEDATGEIERPVSLSIRTLNGTAIRGEDFVMQGYETTSFSPGSKIGTTKCFTLQLVNKTSATIKFFSLLLTSDDPALKVMNMFNNLSIRIIQTSLQVPRVTMTTQSVFIMEESRVVQLCAIITRGAMTENSVFNLLILANTATDTLDYVSGELTIDFKSGDAIGSTRCTHIAIIDDDLLESNETFYAVLTSSNDAIATASPTVTSVTILDDRRKVIEIGFEMNDYTTWEAPNTTIAVCCKILHTNLTLGRSLEVGVVVLSNLTTATGYSLPRSFKFAVGNTENSTQCINVTIHSNDSNVNNDDKLVLALVSLDQNAFVAVAHGYDVATVHIKDSSNFIEIHWIEKNYVVKEGATVELCAIGSGALRKDIVVMVNVSLNTATLEDIYIHTRTLLFRSNQTAISGNSISCFLIRIVDDMLVESNENFSVKLLSSDIVLVSPMNTTTTVTILDDPSDVILIDWSERAFSAIEGIDSQVFICAVILKGTLEMEIIVPFTNRTETASMGNDFTISTWFFKFSSGQSQYNNSTSCISLHIINDNILEEIESLYTLKFTKTGLARYLPFRTDVNITIYEDQSDVAEFSLEQNKYIVTEGLNNTVSLCTIFKVGNLGKTVTLRLESESAAVANYNVEGHINYQPGSSAADNSTQCFIVDIINDNIVEDTQVIILRLTVTSSGCAISGNSSSDGEVELTIFDDPADEISIGWSISSYVVTEGEDAEILICADIVNGTLLTTVIVPFINLTRIAIFGSDFILSSWFLKFTSGQSQYNWSTSCVSMFILNDTILEDTESFTLGFASANRTSYLPFRTVTNITILEDQNDRAEFSLIGNAYEVTEGLNSTISVCVLLKFGYLAKPVKLILESQSGSLVTDYSIEGNIIFQPGSSAVRNATQCFILDIINDDIVENTEQFQLRLNVTSSYCILSSESLVSLTIKEDPADVVILSFQSKNYYTNESLNTNILKMCIVILKGSLEQDIFITIVANNGTALYNVDYTLDSTEITFTSGQNQSYNNTQCKTITVLDDSILEYNESFTLSLVAAHPVMIQPINTTTVVIIEDGSDLAEFSLMQHKLYVSEGLNNSINVCTTLKVGSLGKAVILKLESKAENSVANYNVEGPIIFQPGSSENDNSTQCVIVNITNDDIVEDTQVIILRLTVMSSGCAISGNSSSDGEVELTIFDDPADVISIGWSRNSYVVTEGEDAKILICADIVHGALQTTVTVPFINVTGIATIGSDFHLLSWFLTFIPGQSQYNWSTSCVSMFIINDIIFEDTESVILGFATANRTSYEPFRTVTNITILEDQNDRAVLSLIGNAYEVTEGLNSTISVCVILKHGYLAKPVKLILESQSGSLVTDYSIEGNIIFQPGSSAVWNATQCFILDIINDDIVENTEQFQLRLNVTSSYCILSSESLVNLTIKEDPADVVILSFQSNNYYTREASRSMSLDVCIVIQKGSLERDISVPMNATNITAMNNADYTLESIFVTFTSGQNQSYNNKKCKTITVLDDSILEYNESFTLSLVATHPVITGAINKTTVVIMEDPSDYVEIGFVKLLYEVDQSRVSIPLKTAMTFGNLQRNVTLTIDLSSPINTETYGSKVIFTMTTKFTYGETSGAVHHEMLNISSLDTIRGDIYAGVTLKPIPEDRGVIHISNNQMFIKITIHSTSVTTLSGIIGGTTLLAVLLCVALMVLAALMVFRKTRKTNKQMPLSKADHVKKSRLQQPQAMLWMTSLPEYN